MIALGLLAALQADRLTFTDPSFSPDGRRIACVVGVTPEGNDRIMRREIWTMNLDGSDPKPVVAEGFNFRPVWSPDGKTLLFERQTSGSRHDLFTVPAAGGSPKQITETSDLSEHKAVYAADGRSVFCLREADIAADAELVRIALADGRAEVLLGREWNVQDADLGPDGRLAVVVKRIEKDRPSPKFSEDFVAAWLDTRSRKFAPLLDYPASQQMSIYGIRVFKNGDRAVTVGKGVPQGVFLFTKNGAVSQIEGARPLTGVAFTRDGSRMATNMNYAGKWGIYLWDRASSRWSTIREDG